MRCEAGYAFANRATFVDAALRVLTMCLLLGVSAAISTPVEAKTPPQESDAPAQSEAAADAMEAESQQEEGDEQGAEQRGEGESDEEEWLVDEETGRRYKFVQIPRKSRYIWIDEDTIRAHGVPFDVVKQDEESLWLKAWEPGQEVRKRRPRAEPTEEERAAVAASYEFDLKETDRLRFEPFDKGLPKRGQWRNGFDIADVNGDGEFDIVFGPARKGRPLPNIFLGDGRGSWRRWNVHYPDLLYDYGDAAAGDLNNDGYADLVFAVHLWGIQALIADGEGRFDPWGEGIEMDRPGDPAGFDATAFSSRAVELLDWNGDGRLDVLALGEGPKGRKQAAAGGITGEIIDTSRGFRLYVNGGDGSWTARQLANTNDFGDSFAVADFNRDGRADLAAASRVAGSRSVLLLSGDDGAMSAAHLSELRPRGILWSVAAADLDGDGDQDLAVGYMSHELGQWRSGVDLYLAGPGPTWQRRTLLAVEDRLAIPALATGNLDNDDHADLVALTDQGEVWIFLGRGGARFEREMGSELPQPVDGCSGSHVRLVDLDRDGRDEVVAAFAGEPTGLPGIADMSQPGCPGEGSLRAWKVIVEAKGGAPSSTESDG
jgi:hypothetical protein